jgi:hypothetical protein
LHDRRSQAVRFIRSRDPKERQKAIEDYPELHERIPIINLVRAGIGSFTEVMELKEKYGIDFLMEINEILAILNQEDELDRR